MWLLSPGSWRSRETAFFSLHSILVRILVHGIHEYRLDSRSLDYELLEGRGEILLFVSVPVLQCGIYSLTFATRPNE